VGVAYSEPAIVGHRSTTLLVLMATISALGTLFVSFLPGEVAVPWTSAASREAAIRSPAP